MLPEHRAAWLASRGLDVEWWSQGVREPTGGFESMNFAFEGNISNGETICAKNALHRGSSVVLTLQICGDGNNKTMSLSATRKPNYDGMPIICTLSFTLSARPSHQNADTTIVHHNESVNTTTRVMIDDNGRCRQTPFFERGFQAPRWLDNTTVMTLKINAKF